MLALFVGASSWAHAQEVPLEVSWLGGGSTDKFTDGGNWAGGVAPVAGETVIVAVGEPTVLVEAGDVIEFGELRFGSGGIAMSGGTITTSGRQQVGYGDAAVDLTMSGGSWMTSERFLLGFQSDNFSATLSGGTSAADRTTLGSTGQYLIVGNGGASAQVALNDYAQLYGATTAKVIIADGSNNTATVTMNDYSNIYSLTNLSIGWSGGTGTVIMNDDSTINSDGVVYIGAGGSGNGTLEMHGNANLTSSGEIIVGQGSGFGSLVMDGFSSINGGQLDVGRDGSGNGLVNMTGDASIVLTGNFSVGRYTASTNTNALTMSGNASISAVNVSFGRWAQGPQMNVDVDLSGDASIAASGIFGIGGALSGEGSSTGIYSVTLSDNASVVSTYSNTGTVKWATSKSSLTLTLSDSSELLLAGTNLLIGDSGGSTTESAGTISLQDSSTMAVKSMIVGHFGADSATGWTVNVGSTTGTGSATLTVADGITLGRNDQSGGGNFSVALNIYNGVVETTSIRNGGGADTTKHTMLVDGGTIRSLADSSEFFTQLGGVDNQVLVTIAAGGATFDTQNFVVSTMLGFSGEGGLTKEGTGTLTLSGTNTYTGATVVAEGTFVVSGTLASTLVQVADDAVLTLESLALLSASTIDLASGAELQLAFSGDLTVSALIVNGTAVDVGTYSVDDLIALGLSVTFIGDNAATLTIIPEPSTYALGVGVLALGLVALRRRNRQAVRM